MTTHSLPSAITLLLLAAAAGGCGGAAEPSLAVAEPRPHGDERPVEVSDLDRPVAELLKARCEHDIPTYTCAECRYEVGVARAEAQLFDPGEGGVLRTAVVTAAPATAVRELPGEVALDANRSVTVTPPAPGIAVEVLVDLGRHVRRGDPVARLESPAYRDAAALVVDAAAAESAAAATLAREEAMFARRICPEKDVVAARAEHARARARVRSAEGTLRSLGLSADEIAALHDADDAGLLVVRSPLDGVVVDRHAAAGARVEPGDPLVVVADTRRMWIQADLHESDVAAVTAAGEHLDAEAEVAAWPGRRFRGTVDRVTGTLDPVTRTARARVVVANPDGLLRAGMFARVYLVVPTGGTAIAVPSEAVLEDEGRTFAFVRATGDYWIRRPITVGGRAGDEVAVLAGLAPGDEIVTRGAFLLKSDVLRSKMGAGCAD